MSKDPKSKAPEVMDDEDSRVAPHRGETPVARRALGRMDDESSVSITAPSPLKKGAKTLPRGAVGLRAAQDRPAPPPKAVEAKSHAGQRVRSGREEHRQKVWDKLDAARKAADDKLPRFDGFSPRPRK